MTFILACLVLSLGVNISLAGIVIWYILFGVGDKEIKILATLVFSGFLARSHRFTSVSVSETPGGCNVAGAVLGIGKSFF